MTERRTTRWYFTAVVCSFVTAFSMPNGAAALDDAATIISKGEGFIESAIADALMAAMDGNDEQLDILETVTDELRKNRIKFESGSGAWKLDTFYNSIEVPSDYPKLEILLERWKQRWPNSPTPYIIKAQQLFRGLFGISWQALRGIGDPRHLTLSIERLKQIQDYLEATPPFTHADPQWYVLVAQTEVLATADSGSPEDSKRFTALVLEGIKREPTYGDLYRLGTDYVLPKWNGSKGDAESLEKWANAAAEAAQQHGVESGYARVYWHAFEAQYGHQLFEMTKVNWAQFKSSAGAYVTELPRSWQLDRMVLMICVAGDRFETKRLYSIRKEPIKFVEAAKNQQEAQRACSSWAQASDWRITADNFYEWAKPVFDVANAMIRLALETGTSLLERSYSRTL